MDATTRDLPSGTVTFLFTDIEGSTRLLRDLEDRYDELLSTHHRILREVWHRHRGVEVNTEGDAFFVAFANAVDGLAAAVDAQRRLAATKWPGRRPLRVRMGLHTGYARPVDDDYRALSVNQAARVADAAHGGQIFATDEVVAFLASGQNAPIQDLSIQTVPLGLFRVRDFDDPIALHRVSAPDLAVVNTPPRVRPADRHNLIRPTTSLVDRVDERVALRPMLGPGKLVTLIGPGGAGKTRLSIEIGFDVVDRWPDGVWFVDLAPLSSGDVIASAIAAAVHAPALPGNDAATDLVTHLADRHQLVILDNCEHLVEPVAILTRRLLQECPGIGLLATSRVPLGLLGENPFRVAPLAVDSADSAAVRLYLERTAHDPHPDLGSIAGLCRELDGLPLAIEIAATRAHLLTPAEIRDQMRSGVAVVSSRDPTLPDRHRSLERLLDWTIDFLGPKEQTALRRLAVIPDDFDGALAEAVIADDSITDDSISDDSITVAEVPELVWSLLDWSLVKREVDAGTTRYSLFSTVRSHTLRRSEPADVALARRRLADTLLDRLGPQRTLSRQWVGEVETELDNIRGVVSTPEVPDAVARPLAWAIGEYHDVRGTYRTGIAELERCIEQRPAPGADLVAVLTLQADLHLRIGATSAAEAIITRASLLAADVGSPAWDDMGLVRTQGELALRSHDPAAAVELAEAALQAGVPSPRGRARLWNLVAIAHYALDDQRASCDALDHCLEAEEEAGLETFLANTHGNYAEGLLQLGDRVGAAEHQLAALEYARSMGQRVNIAFSCMLAARFASEDGDVVRAVTLQTGADRMLDREGFSLYARDAEQREEFLAAARRDLGAEAFTAAVDDGDLTSSEQLADQTAAILQRVASTTASHQERHP